MADFIGEPVISITQIGRYVTVSLTDQMTDEMIRTVEKSILKETSHGTAGVLLDYSMVETMDSCAFKAFRNITATLEVMGIPSVWVSLKPGVVCSMLDLEIDFGHCLLRTAGTIKDAIFLLEKELNKK